MKDPRLTMLTDLVDTAPGTRAQARRSIKRAVRRRVVNAIDHSPTTSRRLVGLLSETSGGRKALTERRYPPAGHALAGRDSSLLPVVLVLVLDSSSQDAADVVDRIVQVQSESLGFRPILLFNGPHLKVARNRGLLGELLMERAMWDSVEQNQRWDDYAQQRIRDLTDLYQAKLSLVTEGPSLRPGQELLLRSLRDGRDEYDDIR